jgi:hypothetical protein
VRTFYLLREGQGVVAEGVEFSNGKCFMHWLSEPDSVAVFDSLADLEEIHGHGGKSKVVISQNADRGGHDQS